MAFKHIGKKVELASTRIDKDLFLERTKTVTNGKINEMALADTVGQITSQAINGVKDNAEKELIIKYSE